MRILKHGVAVSGVRIDTFDCPEDQVVVSGVRTQGNQVVHMPKVIHNVGESYDAGRDND
jgi:hypothetical protein